MTDIPDVDLEQARDLGAATYMSAYVHLMMRALGVDDDNKQAVNALAMQMVEPLNHATEAIWRALMRDTKGTDAALLRFQHEIKALNNHITFRFSPQ